MSCASWFSDTMALLSNRSLRFYQPCPAIFFYMKGRRLALHEILLINYPSHKNHNFKTHWISGRELDCPPFNRLIHPFRMILYIFNDRFGRTKQMKYRVELVQSSRIGFTESAYRRLKVCFKLSLNEWDKLNLFHSLGNTDFHSLSPNVHGHYTGWRNNRSALPADSESSFSLLAPLFSRVTHIIMIPLLSSMTLICTKIVADLHYRIKSSSIPIFTSDWGWDEVLQLCKYAFLIKPLREFFFSTQFI